jgi:hypothetical protein
MDLYRLRDAPRSVKLAAVLFLLVLGYAYIFAFLMVKTWSGLSPSDVAATYVPKPAMNMEAMPEHSTSTEQPLNLGTVPDMKHTVDTNLLIEDSHIHIMIYAIVAALQSLIIFGLGWPDWFRDWMIVAAFGFGALDFAGQWLMKANLPGFAWLTILSGWGMSLVYLIVLGGTLRAVVPRRTIARSV